MNAVKTNGVTALWMAAQFGRTTIVRNLLASGADVNIKANINGKDYTPLCIAKMMSNAQIITLLEEYGAKD